MEDLGRKSKSNSGQVELCRALVAQLRDRPVPSEDTLAILTPYTRQMQLLKRGLPNETISSIDGFQGQEADVIVYVTVRCNMHRDIGFLKDMRRLNVALTRARSGMVIIGDEPTLTGKGRRHDQGDQAYYLTWQRLISASYKCTIV